MHDEDRAEVSAKFHEGQYRCLITTVAYGMGIDIDDVTLVIHWGESSSVLAMWQEVGRAGRRGQESQAITFHRGDSQRVAEKNA